METDVNNEQVVTATEDANTEQVVTAPDVNTEVVEQQATEQAEANQEQAVPYERFKEVNEAKKAAEEQASYAQRQLDLYQQNTQQNQQVQQQPKSTSQMALEQMGITADELFGENIVTYQQIVSGYENQARQQNAAAMNTQQFMMTHPDLSSVVGSVNPATGLIMQPTPELMALVGKKPYLQQAPVEQLYNAVIDERKFAELEKAATIQKEHQVRTGVKTATQPLGGSAAGGGGAGSQGKQQLLSREQSEEIERKLAAGEIIS